MKDTEHRHYSMDPVIAPDARVLILGSMPGARSLAMQQYYACPRNQFWRVMAALFQHKETFENYQEKCDFLTRNRIGLWDSIRQCTRKGSLDSAIRDAEPNAIPQLLKKYRQIRLVAFNGSKSIQVFKKHFGLELLILTGIRYVQLPSTSPTPTRRPKSFEEKLREWSVIRDFC
ncbi:DNA-deoxyinosine glycosylase [Sporolactobacillus sp. THM19-2]|uniref:DNA-deoxyinosine glycosylase n=1 Tax=Sporolactobacillus sp. THM19-2 TaxID=2511171 RepID=UPI00101F7221|nr:DNA-deoxyinosine glycosylase [Sporolactobacillus sp. THM19-2]RYL92385.1 DNA-deoxyinosine glycosylase [Sporolactobacillus sp. THM19-2]